MDNADSVSEQDDNDSVPIAKTVTLIPTMTLIVTPTVITSRPVMATTITMSVWHMTLRTNPLEMSPETHQVVERMKNSLSRVRYTPIMRAEPQEWTALR